MMSARLWEWLRRVNLAAGVVLLGLAAPVRAQVTPAPTWSQQSPATSPSARAFAAMAYDAGTNQVVLFGGQDSSGNLNDTWTWNGTTWTQMSPATSPPARRGAAMTYDAGTNQVVLFGGQGSSVDLNDTWTWNGTTWTEKTPATSPSARDTAVMAYDPSSGLVVLFGGQGNGLNFLGDTWTWNGTTWTQQTPATSPSARGNAVMAYDATSGQELLFGGQGNGTGFPFLNDTWTWNGTTWTQLSPATSPPLTGQAVMAYDANSGQELLFGGVNTGGSNILGDTWTWNGTTWTQQTPATSPEARFSATMAYDPSSGLVVLFGGGSNSGFLGDTWTLQQGPVNLGSANVCTAGATTPSPCSQTTTLAFDVAAGTTISSISVLTQGAPNLDFKAATTQGANACATQTYTSATTCTVTVTFAPEHPGKRLGAVVLQDSADDPPATTYVFGTGQGPQLTFGPPTQSTIPATGLLHSQGVAVDSSGNVYLADSNNNRVLKETLSGGSYTQSTILATGLAGPEGVAVDGAGNVYIANTEGGSGGNGNVLLETLSGGSYTQSTIPATGLMSPVGVAVDGSGNVYIANFGGGGNGNVLKETLSDGGYTQSTIPATGLAGPIGVAVDGSGNVYIANLNGGSGTTGNVLLETLADGGYTQSTIPATGLLGPEGVTVDSNGNVYIANTSGGSGTGTVLKETLAGGSYTQSTIPATGLDFPAGVAVDSSGNVYIANFGDGSSEPGSVLMENYADTPMLTFRTSTDDGTTDTTDGAPSVTITNDGNEPLTAISPGLSVAANFTQVDGSGTPADCTASFSLAANASCNISIEFAPLAGTASGTVNGSVTLTDNNLNATPSTMQTIQLVGTGVDAAPTVTGVSPNSGSSPTGTVVTITGTNFTGATAVSFGTQLAFAFSVLNANTILAHAPPSPSPGNTTIVNVTVTNPDGTSATSPAVQFTYLAQPNVGPILPTSGPASGGTSVMIQGINFTGVTAVSFGNTPAASFTFVDDNNILAVSPAGTGTANVTVTNPVGTSSNNPVADSFTYIQPVSLTNSSLAASPMTLPAGASTTITLMVKAVNNNLLSGVPVNISVAGASGKATISSPSSTTSGIFSFTLTDPVAENVAITASLGSPFVGSLTANVTFVAPAYVVTVNTDESTGNGVAANCVDPNVSTSGNTNCGLRDAVAAANALTGVTTSIGFASSLGSTATPGTITIAQAAPITLTQNMTITGPGASALTISGANQFQVIEVNSGVTAAIGNLTIANGHNSMQGGGISNAGTLTVTGSAFANNSAGGVPSGGNGGGAIFASAGVLTVRNSTIAGNTSAPGGAISASNGTVTIDRSTFSGNSALGTTTGGAIFINNAAVTITESTISGNVSAGGGGAVFNNATLTAANTIVAGNTGGDCGAGGSETCPANGANGNVIGVANIGLAPLGNYGGPTQTLIPLPGSPAICAGSQADILSGVTTDQRGLPNTNTSYPGFSAGAACVDAGAVQTNYALSFTQQPSNTVSGVSMLPAPAVTLTESGNAFTAAGVTVPLTLSGPGTLSGGSATTSAGVATYSSLNLSTPGSGDTLTATLSLNPALTPALSLTTVSSEFNIIAGTPTAANSSFVLPATTVAGTTITGTLTLKDQNGNPVVPTSVTFTTASNTTTFSTPTTVTTSNGMATIGFSDTKAETVAISVSVGGTPFLSGTVQITPAAPASVSVVSGTPQSATVNTHFAAPLVVMIEDKFGNPTPNVAVPPFLAPASGASATLTTVAETNSNGQANMTATANGTSGSYNVTVTEQNTTATFALTNNAGTPTAANSSFALPPTALAGAIVTGTLTLKDQNGNPVLPTSVTFTTTSKTTAFSTPTTVITANGLAMIGFSDTKAETVTISVSVGGTPFPSGAVQIAPAQPASVSVVSGTPQSATVNTQFAAPLVVVIEDKYGNPTPNVAAPSFSVPTTGASATLTTVAETNSNGQANVTATANGTSGSYNVTVTEQNTTATLALTNTAAIETITFTQPASPVTYGVAPITLVASANSQLPVTFTVTGPATVNGSILTITGTGTVGITASQTGNPTYAAAPPVMRSLTVDQQPTITSVSASPSVATPVQTVTLTATVSATTAGTATTPTGTVIFLDNGVQLGAAVNVVNGAATLTVPSLPSAATDSITATYSGNGNFLASTSSNGATVTVASLDFSFTNTATTAYTTAPGAVATYSFGLSPLYGSYAGTVNFTVTGLPAGATASFTPSTVAVGAGATPVVMTVQTASATAHNRNPFGRGIVLALLFLPFAGKRSVREKMKGRMLLLLLLMAGLTATLTGCGSTSGFLLENPQTYTLTVTATSGTLQHSKTVTLIVQ